ncbi:hypothetical protein EVA_16118 [gut metagenome]|uniref:Uncharacterized protein n=1 Tax=gut metagenome TaxID=749906 RepID=J9C7E5_9ZZZZ
MSSFSLLLHYPLELRLLAECYSQQRWLNAKTSRNR